MKITATINYPIIVLELELPDTLTVEEVKEALLVEADEIFPAYKVEPVITDCSDPKYND